MPNTHILKVRPEYFDPILDKRKTFEIRENDRNYRCGDVVVLQEYDVRTGYTGRVVEKTIGYVSVYGQVPGWCVFSLL